jgi:uncharacterized protein YegL
VSDHFLDEPVDERTDPTPRLPVSLCLDVSSSMRGVPIKAMNAGLKALYAALAGDPRTKAAAQIGLTAFAREARPVGDFETLGAAPSPPDLKVLLGGPDAGGLAPGTNLGLGVKVAVDRLVSRVKCNRDQGLSAYRPFLVIISDGMPTVGRIEEVAKEVRGLEQRRRLAVMPLGAGPNADLDALSQFAAARHAVCLEGYRFDLFFHFLYESIVAVSTSRPGDRVRLDAETLRHLEDAIRPAAPAARMRPAPPAASAPPVVPPPPKNGVADWGILY